MSKKKIFSFIFILALLPLIWPVSVSASKKTVKKTVKKAPVATVKDLPGRLVLEYENSYKLWYVDPDSKERYYLHTNEDLQLLAKELAVTPTVSEFSKLAKNKKSLTPATLAKKYAGRIILNPKSTTTAYYFNPADRIAYLMDNFSDFYQVGKIIGIGASDKVLRQLDMNQRQFTYDPAYYGTTQVQYADNQYSFGKDSGRILPLASLTKVMTALVFIDTNPDWEKVIEVTPEEIRYPCTLQACGSTSEVDLKTWDKVKIKDLWIAMLTASSNQSAKILADNSGLSQAEFVQKMNDKAKALGLTKTKFVEMSGLSAENISTAEEFAKIAQAAFSNDTIASATRYTDYIFTVDQNNGLLREVDVKNRNYSLLAFEPVASKTGFLVEAQRNAAIMKDGKVIVVLHAYSLDQRNSIVRNILEGSELASAQ